MGEEKPDEELMGKRKSSPRLSTTFGDVDNLSLSGTWGFIPQMRKISYDFFRFSIPGGLWYDIDRNFPGIIKVCEQNQ